MECASTTWLTNEEYLKDFHRKIARLHIPITGSIALTHRCNLKCIHCYLGGTSYDVSKEMNTKKILSVIDEITEAGCLYLLITGGEPFIRKDFSEVYRHAKMNGLIVTIFSNGTLITDELLDLFLDLPPYSLEISLYGATASTYEKITRVPGSYGKCLTGIHKLLDYKINMGLKTVLMTLNCHEFFQIEDIAKNLGVKFRFDADIFPRFNGDKYPITLRVLPEEAIEKEFSDKERKRQWEKYYKKTQGLKLSENLYNCGAGNVSFHIEPDATLKPCLMTNNISYNLYEGDFLQGWENVLPRIKDLKARKTLACNLCEKRHVCAFCPAFFGWENGGEDTRSEYLCAMGHWRFKKVYNKV